MNYPKDLLEVTKEYFGENIDVLINSEPDDLYSLHMDFGMFLRNHYKMWAMKDEELPEDEYGFPCHPDDASFEYIKRAQKLLKTD